MTALGNAEVVAAEETMVRGWERAGKLTLGERQRHRRRGKRLVSGMRERSERPANSGQQQRPGRNVNLMGRGSGQARERERE